MCVCPCVSVCVSVVLRTPFSLDDKYLVPININNKIPFITAILKFYFYFKCMSDLLACMYVYHMLIVLMEARRWY